jgi:hypothetical protein
LCGCGFIDSTGLTALFGTARRRQLADAPRVIVVCSTGGFGRRILDFSDMTHLFEIVDDRGAAEQAANRMVEVT